MEDKRLTEIRDRVEHHKQMRNAGWETGSDISYYENKDVADLLDEVGRLTAREEKLLRENNSLAKQMV